MRQFFAFVVALALLASGCGDGQTDAPVTSLDPSIEAPAVSTTLTPPTTTAVTANTASDTTTPMAGGIDLVVMGDSFSRAAWPQMFAALVAEDLDSEVRLHNLSRDGNPEYARFLEAGIEELATAEIVVVQPDVGAPLDRTERSYLNGTCGGTDGEDCLRESIAGFVEDWEAFLDELARIVPDQVILRSLTVATWTYEGFFGVEFLDDPAYPVLQGYLIEANDLASKAAQEHGFVIVDINRAFNGDDYSERAPREWLAGDLLHLSEEGAMVTAELIRSVGYGPAAQATSDPIAVIEQWNAAWNAEDLDAYAALYAEDATETFSNQTYEGREAIRDFYEGWRGRFTMECADYQVSGNTVTYRCVLTGTPGPVTGEIMEAVIVDEKIESIEVIGRFQP